MEFPEEIKQRIDLKFTFSSSVSPANIIRGIEKAEFEDSEILYSEQIINQVEGNFPMDSQFLEAHTQSNTTAYEASEVDLPTSIHTGDSSYYHISFGEVDRFVELPAGDATAEFGEEIDKQLESAERIDLDIPSWNTLLAKLEEEVDTATRQEFERLIQAAQLENLGALDEVSVALVAAAQSGALMYDLSKWGEEVGLASKATFSRRKTSLEDNGVIYTEKVPIEIGRPKQRLQLSEDLSGVDIDLGITDSELGLSTAEAPSKPTVSDRDVTESKQANECGSTSEQSNTDTGPILTTIEKEIQKVISQ